MPLVADLLMDAAFADQRLEGEEKATVRRILSELLGAPSLPMDLAFRVDEFEPGRFDRGAAARAFAGDPTATKRRLLELVAAVHAADGDIDFAEDEHLRAVATALALPEDAYRDLVVAIVDEIDVAAIGDDLDRLRYGAATAAVRYLHTMLRVRDLDAALDFFVGKLGLCELRRRDNEKGRFTLVFLGSGAPGDPAQIELTYNWDQKEAYPTGRFFGHLAYEVDDIYGTCERLRTAGVTILRPPRDGHMAFIKSPDGHSVELLQRGDALPPKEPWASMPSQGEW